jgi:hypothetical protein
MDEKFRSGVPARTLLLNLACETSLYRVIGMPGFAELVSSARRVARAAMCEGVPLFTPLTDLFMAQGRRFGGGETLGWHYRRAYRIADVSLDPLRFFSIAYVDNFVVISSSGVAGAYGEVRICEASADEVFECVAGDSLGSYRSWAEDTHPIGSRPRLLRMDDGARGAGEVHLEVGDLHPCRGTLCFGDPSQECEQLAAFSRLHERASALFAAARPSDVRRAEVAKAAAAIIREARDFCFFPGSGYCSSCGADVTSGVTDAAAAAQATSCRVCSRSWCD